LVCGKNSVRINNIYMASGQMSVLTVLLFYYLFFSVPTAVATGSDPALIVSALSVKCVVVHGLCARSQRDDSSPNLCSTSGTVVLMIGLTTGVARG